MARNTVLVAATAVLLVALGWALFAYHRHAEEVRVATVQAQQLVAAQAVADRLTSWVALQRADLRLRAADAGASPALPMSGDCAGWAVYDAGRLIAASSRDAPLPLVAHDEVHGKPASGEIFLRTTATHSARPDRIAVGDFNLSRAATKSVASSVRFGRWHAWVIDSDGTVVHHSAQSSMQLHNIRRRTAECATCHDDFKHVHQMMRQGSGVVTYKLRHGDDQIAAFASTATAVPLMAVISMPRATAVGGIRREIALTLSVSLALIIAVTATWLRLFRVHSKAAHAQEEARRWKETAELQQAVSSAEQRYEELLSSIHGIVWECDARTLQFEYVSRQAAEFLGCGTAKERDSLIDHVYGDDRHAVMRGFFDVAASGVPASIEYRVAAEAGRTVWLRNTISRIDRAGGAKLRGVIVDITDRKDAERALRESESRFRALFEQSAVGIVVRSRTRAIVDTNAAFREMFGYSQAELRDLALGRLADSSARDLMTENLDALWFGAIPRFDAELPLIHRDGRRIWCRVAASIVRDVDGLPSLLVVSFEDVTVRNNADRELAQSREKFRRLVEMTADVVWSTDAHGVYTYVSPGVRTVLGYEPDELIGRRPFDLMPAAEAERVSAIYNAAVEARKPLTLLENVNTRRDGAEVILETSAAPVLGDHGEFLGYQGIDRDVTDREEYKRALRRVATAITASADIILITDREGVIEYANPAFERITGFTREEVAGCTPRVLKSGAQGAEFYAALWSELVAGRTWTGRFVNRRKNGSFYEADATISPILSESGDITGFVALQRDVTEHVALLERLRRAEEMERLGRLISGVAHEVRNPLNAIQAAAATLALDHEDDSEGAPILRAISSHVKRLAQLMQELLEFSRPLQPSRFERWNLEQLCRESIAAWQASHPDQPPDRIRFAAAGSGRCTVNVDAIRIQQVLINLLDNASQHAPPAQPIIVSVERCEPHAHITVRDFGPGIRLEHLPRIFDPFFTTRRGGTGLGLALVKSIVEQHGGRVAVRNNDPEAGCTAEIVLDSEEEEESHHAIEASRG